MYACYLNKDDVNDLNLLISTAAMHLLTRSSIEHEPKIARLRYCELVNAITATEPGPTIIVLIQQLKNAGMSPKRDRPENASYK